MSCRPWWRRRPRPVAARSVDRGVSHDLAGMITTAAALLLERLAVARPDGFDHDAGVAKLAWLLLAEEPADVVGVIDEAIDAGINPDELVASSPTPPPCASPVSTRRTITPIGTRCTTPSRSSQLARPGDPPGADTRAAAWRLSQRVPRIDLDRFLNVPAARWLPEPEPSSDGVDHVDLSELQGCWDQEGRVDDAGTIIYRFLRAGGDPYG